MSQLSRDVRRAEPAARLPLSQLLRAGTRRAHRLVESMAFVRLFLRGVVEPASYRQLLLDLHCIYGHLEENLRLNADHPLVAPLILPALWRQPALTRDLAFFASTSPTAPSRAARRYGARLDWLGAQRPELLVAHSYTRYLGDLSGGQILRRVAARALQLDDEQGLAFYDFPQIANVELFKQEYRARLDCLPLGGELAEELVTEAVTAFTLNGEVFSALSGNAWQGLWKLVVS